MSVWVWKGVSGMGMHIGVWERYVVMRVQTCQHPKVVAVHSCRRVQHETCRVHVDGIILNYM